MKYTDLRDFITALEKRGELVRIQTEVDPHLEMTEIADRTLRGGGPALLFENPKGFDTPVLVNLFGTEKRVALGLLLRQIIVDKNLTADEATIRSRVEELCAGYENADDMVNMYLGNPQLMEQVEPMVIEQQAIDWIIEHGKSKAKKISFKDYMNAPAS